MVDLWLWYWFSQLTVSLSSKGRKRKFHCKCFLTFVKWLWQIIIHNFYTVRIMCDKCTEWFYDRHVILGFFNSEFHVLSYLCPACFCLKKRMRHQFACGKSLLGHYFLVYGVLKLYATEAPLSYVFSVAKWTNEFVVRNVLRYYLMNCPGWNYSCGISTLWCAVGQCSAEYE